MQCPNCGAIEPDGAVACQLCGARLLQEVPATTTSPLVNAGGAPYTESAWAEYGGTPGLVETPVSGSAPILPLSPAPGAYAPPSNNASAIGSSMPAMVVPSPLPPPKGQGLPLRVAALLGVLALLLICGSGFIGFRIGQSSHETTTKQTAAPAGTSSTPDASQLYRQVTGHKPTFVDTLLDAQSSSWSVFEKPKYGCEFKSDGLHVHTVDTGHFAYCTSGRGKLSNFAFQVEMKMLSGNGGGITFRGDTVAGNVYFFHVFPDGEYRIGLDQNNHFITVLAEGAINSFVYATGQKNMLTIIAENSQFYLYDNQQLITKLQDTAYSSGYLGVAASDSTDPTEVVYTNAQLWIL